MNWAEQVDQLMTPSKLLFAAASLVILKTVGTVLLSYRGYFPPDFQTDFLLGREAYFFGRYQGFFYAHIVSGPLSLLLGMLLLSDWLRQRKPKLHRMMGRVQVACVLGVLPPVACGCRFMRKRILRSAPLLPGVYLLRWPLPLAGRLPWAGEQR